VVYSEYTCLKTDEVIDYALGKDNSTSLERELAQRLEVALGMIGSLEDLLNGNDT
jgi:hypothetical protein